MLCNEAVLIDKIMKKGNRVLIWGACERNNEILEFFKKHGVNAAGYIDRNADKQHTYNGLRVFAKDIIKGGDYFVYVGLLDTYDEITAYFEENNYREFDDYWYPCRKVVLDGGKSYKDLYGNEYVGENYQIDIKLNNGGKLHIGDNCELDNAVINVCYMSEVNIGDNCELDNAIISAGDMSEVNIGRGVVAKTNLEVNAYNNSKIIMGDNCKWWGRDSLFGCGVSSVIHIGEGTSGNSNLVAAASQNSKIIIGRDCMLSYNIVIRAGNSHNMFDIEAGKNLSEAGRSVVLGEHVWIGQRAVLFNGCEIGSGSIVGINAFVNKKFPANCSIAGNPARIIKQNVAWRRETYPYFDSYDDFSEFDYK